MPAVKCVYDSVCGGFSVAHSTTITDEPLLYVKRMFGVKCLTSHWYLLQISVIFLEENHHVSTNPHCQCLVPNFCSCSWLEELDSDWLIWISPSEQTELGCKDWLKPGGYAPWCIAVSVNVQKSFCLWLCEMITNDPNRIWVIVQFALSSIWFLLIWF